MLMNAPSGQRTIGGSKYMTRSNGYPLARRNYSFDGINHDVTRLRSLYASLLTAIAVDPAHTTSAESKEGLAISKEDLFKANESHYSAFQIDEDDDEDDDHDHDNIDLKDHQDPTKKDLVCDTNPLKSNQEPSPTYVVRNFRRSVSSDSLDGEDDQNYENSAPLDKIHFEPVTPSKSSNHAWQTLSAYRKVDEPNESKIESAHIKSASKQDAIQVMKKARNFECRVIEFIRSIGELAICGERRTMEANKGNRSTKSFAKWGYTHSHYNNQTESDSQGAIFEYFCDKNILSLLVDIVKARPHQYSSSTDYGVHQSSSVSSTWTVPSPTESSSSISHINMVNMNLLQTLPFNGVVWSPRVKAQVIRTIQILISNVKDPKSLYYLLSNNYINELILSILPLQQWSESAIQEILPSYISFLKTLALQLTNAPHLFQFFCQTITTDLTTTATAGEPTSELDSIQCQTQKQIFPLFQAAVEVASSPMDSAQNDIFVHTTALDIILNLFQLKHHEIRTVISEADREQRYFAACLSRELNVLFDKLVNSILENDHEATIVIEQRIDDKLAFVNDILWCSVRSMNVKLCEYIMHQFVYKTLLQNILVSPVSEHTVHQQESIEKRLYILSQTSLYVQTKIFSMINYAPLLKMASVALLHPYSPLSEQLEEMEKRGDEFVMTPALNAIAQNDFVVIGEETTEDLSNSNFSNALMEESTTFIVENECDSQESDDSTISIAVSANSRRSSIIRHLSGDFGCKGFITAAAICKSVFHASSLDFQMMKMLGMVPDFMNDGLDLSSKSSMDEDNAFIEEKEQTAFSPFEEALGRFLSKTRTPQAKDDSIALSMAASLSISFIGAIVQSYAEDDTTIEQLKEKLSSSLLLQGVKTGRDNAIEEFKKLSAGYGVKEVLPQLVEAEIKNLYLQPTNQKADKNLITCNLEEVQGIILSENHTLLNLPSIQKLSNGIDDITISIQKILTLRLVDLAVNDMINHVHSIIKTEKKTLNNDDFKVNALRPASKDILDLGALQEQTVVGSDFDASGKALYSFLPSLAISETEENRVTLALSREAMLTDAERRRKIADKILLNSSVKSTMSLVVDSEGLCVLRPNPKTSTRGTILCHAMMQNILAVASDGQWLHIAMRNVEDVGVLIQKGKSSSVLLSSNRFLCASILNPKFLTFPLPSKLIGNMALRFQSADVCNDVLTSIEKCRNDAKLSIIRRIELFLK